METDKLVPGLVTRRAFSRYLLGGVASPFLVSIPFLAACGDDDEEGSPDATGGGEGEPRTGGTLVYGLSFGLEGEPLNPIRSPGSLEGVARHVYESLWDVDSTGTVRPKLAEATEFSEDGLTWTLTLREGVMFHDGTPFNAEAVKTNIELRKSTDTFPLKSYLDVITGVTAVDERTVQFDLSVPGASLQAILSGPLMGILSPTALETYPDAADYARNAAGTGAFKADGNVPTDQSLALVRNDDYWGDKAYLDRLEWQTSFDLPARVAALEAGDFDVIDDLAGPEFVRLQEAGEVVLHVSEIANENQYIYFNCSKDPVSDKRVRQAIVYGTDRDSYLPVFPGLGETSDSLVTPNVVGYSGNPPYPYDVERSAALLAEAGVEPGTPLRLITGPRAEWIELAQLVKQDLDRMGFETTIRQIDTLSGWVDEMGSSRDDSAWEVSVLSAGYDYLDAEATLYRFFLSANDAPVGQNWTHYSNERVDELLVEQAALTDTDARAEALAEVQAITWDEVPMYAVLRNKTASASTSNVHGLEVISIGHPTFFRTWVDE